MRRCGIEITSVHLHPGAPVQTDGIINLFKKLKRTDDNVTAYAQSDN